MPDSNPHLTLPVLQRLDKITSWSELPAPPVLKVDGTAAGYPNFIANFQDRVGSRQLADGLKLSQLVMCTQDGVYGLIYLERSKVLKLKMLEERRIKADLEMVFKLMINVTDFCTSDMFRYSSTRSGHDRQLFVFYSRIEKSQFYWSNRLVLNWNRLSQITVNNTWVYGFKRSLRVVKFIGRASAYCLK